jgi:hypothetical protein
MCLQQKLNGYVLVIEIFARGDCKILINKQLEYAGTKERNPIEIRNKPHKTDFLFKQDLEDRSIQYRSL